MNRRKAIALQRQHDDPLFTCLKEVKGLPVYAPLPPTWAEDPILQPSIWRVIGQKVRRFVALVRALDGRRG